MSRIDASLRSDRRHFLMAVLAGGAALVAGGGVLVPRLRAAARRPTDVPGPVWLEMFADDGRDLGVHEVPRLVLSEAQWRARLSPAAYYQMRMAATERPFTGRYWNFYGRGIFRCAACGTALYDADTKFHSGTGWPSFYQPIARRNVIERVDNSYGMFRTAIACAGCNSHLGHVFHDGPRPTGLRYCMNSPALRFAPYRAA